MRKKLAVLIAVITAAMMLFGCGGKDMSGSEYLGKWKATLKIYQINFTINPTGTQIKVSKICSYFVLTNIRSFIIMNIYSKEQMFT